VNSILEKRLFTIVRNEPLAVGIFQLTLSPKGEMFTFKAGQWVYLYLLKESNSEWAHAAFSIASAPSDSSKTIDLAIKVYKDYTKRAQILKIGEMVRIQGPFGMFTLNISDEPLVLYAAGIGVTPFMSMIREEFARGQRREIILFYTNKTKSDIAYEIELRELMRIYSQFTVVFFLTRSAPGHWNGETKRLDATIIRRMVADPVSSEHFMCGPNEFMDAITKILISLGVDIKIKLRKERFS